MPTETEMKSITSVLKTTVRKSIHLKELNNRIKEQNDSEEC